LHSLTIARRLAYLARTAMPSVPNLRDYLLIRDAASFLGVSEATLRNWDRGGKVAAHRNPINGYRLFKKSDLEELLKKVAHSGSPRRIQRRARR